MADQGRGAPHEAGEEGRGQISCRALCIMVRNLDFILNGVRNHWQVLSIRIIWYFINFFLTAVWKMDCRKQRGSRDHFGGHSGGQVSSEGDWTTQMATETKELGIWVML